MKHAFLTTAAAALMALGSYAEAQSLKMSHVRPQDATIDVELRAFSVAVDEATGWEVAEADQGRNEQRLVDELGATVVALSDEEFAAMAAKARAEVWPAVLEDVGADWGQAILDKVAAAGN